MDGEKRPNSLTENQVQFKVFISVDNDTSINEQIDIIYKDIIECTELLGSKYMWNNESFFLTKPIRCEKIFGVVSTSKKVYYSCMGVCDYGDNIEDEWFIVYLLNSLTLKYPGKIATQCFDADGEFLLIHTAHFLPNWAQSAGDDCMKNRVFLYNGELHMIPPASKPSEITYLPAAGPIDNDLNAVKCVFDFPKLTKALSTVNECIMNKLKGFELSDLSKTCFHRTTCIIPAKLAWLLNHNPSLISAAVNRFCEKDPDDLKLCRFLNHFQPTDLVSYRVQFTKHLYGKLKYSEYKQDKRHEWPSVESLMDQNLGTTIKFESYSDSAPAKEKNISSLVRERSLIGFKLTCAFEILLNNILNNKNSKSFETYLDKLKKLGYFKNFMENSLKYNELMEKAKESFLLHEKINDSSKSTKSDTNISEPNSQKTKEKPTKPTVKNENYLKTTAKLLESIYLDNKKPREDHFTQLKTEITKNQDTGTDDSDDWLCVEAPALDDYLDMYSRGDVSSTYDFSIISNAFKRFLEVPKAKKDLLEGVEYNSIDSKNKDENPGELIDFDMGEIEKNLKDLLIKQGNPETTGKTKKEDTNLDIDENEDSENDSFYEIDDDLLEDNLEDEKNTENIEKNLKSYMGSMDSELKESKNLSRVENNKDKTGVEELDLDLNLVSNALESYSSQLGCTGPVSNILKSLGL